MWKPEYFATSWDDLAKQVLPEEVYERHGVQGLRFMDERILITLDTLRKNLGVPLTVNNWLWGGNRNQSGYRDVDYYGSVLKFKASRSDHKYGRAIDFKAKGMAAHEVRKHILENKELYPYINFLECGPLSNGKEMTWTHASVRIVLDEHKPLRCWCPKYGYVTTEYILKNKL